jgi:putative ABC transport system ATP-binding protein
MLEASLTESGNPILEAENISLIVNSNNVDRRIINDFSFSFYERKIYNILGPSGAGKSSLLRLFNRLDEISDGKIAFRGKDIKEVSPCWLRQKVGYLVQIPHMFPTTVKDNLLFVDSSLTGDQMISMLSDVNLGPAYLLSKVEILSVGEKQRIALARLLALDPEVILLDEPTSALDEKNSSLVQKLIRSKVSGNGMTAIVVTHDPRQALTFDSEALLIIDGKLVEYGPARELISRPKSEAGKSYLERENE